MLSLVLSLLSLFLAVRRTPLQRSAADTASTAEAASGEIEVGATGPDLRYWLAKEAVRQGEMSLKFQAATFTQTTAQATTMLGWVITAASAAIGISIGSAQVRWHFAALTVATGFMLTAGLCIKVVYPQDFPGEGLDPDQLLTIRLPTELEVLEAIGKGYSTTIGRNKLKLVAARRLLAMAWLAFAMTPVAGGLVLAAYSTHLAAPPLTSHRLIPIHQQPAETGGPR
jgi:hypothetical protein